MMNELLGDLTNDFPSCRLVRNTLKQLKSLITTVEMRLDASQ